MEFYMEDASIDRLLAPFLADEPLDLLLSEEIPCPYRPQRTGKRPAKPTRRRKGGRA
jgi:hypothetical protein